MIMTHLHIPLILAWGQHPNHWWKTWMCDVILNLSQAFQSLGMCFAISTIINYAQWFQAHVSQGSVLLFLATWATAIMDARWPLVPQSQAHLSFANKGIRVILLTRPKHNFSSSHRGWAGKVGRGEIRRWGSDFLRLTSPHGRENGGGVVGIPMSFFQSPWEAASFIIPTMGDTVTLLLPLRIFAFNTLKGTFYLRIVACWNPVPQYHGSLLIHILDATVPNVWRKREHFKHVFSDLLEDL